MTRVLVVDDEAPIRRTMAVNLKARGYDVDLAENGKQALELAARHHPDVVLLDLGLPDLDGIEVIDGLRGWSHVPIVVLSAGARSGTRSPLSTREPTTTSPNRSAWTSCWRVCAAAVRRGLPSGEQAVIATDDFTIDLASKQVVDREGDVVRLTPTEWHLLEVLVRNAGRLVGHRQLLQEVWGPEYGDESNYLRVHMAHLRGKLEPDRTRPRYFVTEAGMGYRYEGPV